MHGTDDDEHDHRTDQDGPTRHRRPRNIDDASCLAVISDAASRRDDESVRPVLLHQIRGNVGDLPDLVGHSRRPTETHATTARPQRCLRDLR